MNFIKAVVFKAINSNYKRYLFFIIALSLPLNLAATNLSRETEFADVMQQQLKSGDLLWLNANNHRFEVLLSENLHRKSLGAAIILHDLHGYPDQKTVPHALRISLTEHRWKTLALQMPLASQNANAGEFYRLLPQAKQRIDATLAYLKQANVDAIILLGYGTGALAALYSFTDGLPDTVKAIVTVDLSLPESSKQKAKTLELIKQINRPMLDIYAEHTRAAFTESVNQRNIAAAANPYYRQIRIDHADHSFHNFQDVLSNAIYSWMNRLISSTPSR